MSNPYFKFKQFIVYHDQCAMKVGIDGVLLGAWTEVFATDENILDIGTGSGLIALMLAQRSDAKIDAIDIDEGAFKQSVFNISSSKWKDRMNVYHTSLQAFCNKSTDKYDLIVSNPPYFISSLKAPEKSRSTARHTDYLSHEDLLESSIKILKKTGRICLILPVDEGMQSVKYAESLNLFCNKMALVHPKPSSIAKRILLEFGFNNQDTLTSKIEIETEQRHIYSTEFSALLKDFYLKL
ncbi:MAG: tRNA (adenosine(37)-N6)-methyltransferase TrmM [Bacteroidales bacterium 36-12]|nr:MAG: tRNA (adenosine(37)-N6)-methyltransferase TrmM [Bacteroidales bacterium 36-12]